MSSPRPPQALSIAGSDSGGGAGIQADLKTFTALGVFGTSVLTAVTAQNTLGVTGLFPLTPEQVAMQLDAVLSDLGTDAAKTGMLVDTPTIEVVADRIRFYRVSPFVLDPVMVAKDGCPLLAPQAQAAMRELLLPLAAVVTPNLSEAEALTGLTVQRRTEMERAARRLIELGARAAVVKGGHLAGAASDDVLCMGDEVIWLSSPRLPSGHTHGTGCTFSAAIAAGLAKGQTLIDAVLQAKEFITLAIKRAPGLGAGQGPTNHLAWMEAKR